MNKLAKYLLVALLLSGLTVSVFARGVQEGEVEEKGKLVLATLNSVEGQTTKKALKAYAELKGIEVEIVEAPYSNLFEKQVLDMSHREPGSTILSSWTIPGSPSMRRTAGLPIWDLFSRKRENQACQMTLSRLRLPYAITPIKRERSTRCPSSVMPRCFSTGRTFLPNMVLTEAPKPGTRPIP